MIWKRKWRRWLQMIKLKIENIKGYEYNLKDQSQNIYNLNLEFLDIKEKPEVGNYIYINNELLNKNYSGYSTSYTFGQLESKYGKENISLDDIDVIKIVKDNIEIYLKRIYG